jgi:hypothetical protein
MADENAVQPGRFNQAFFLDLAAKGKDDVTFAGVDFSDAPRDGINFARFEFGDRADFSGCKWRGLRWEEIPVDAKAFWPCRAFFTGAAFGAFTNLIGAAFGAFTAFTGAAFGVSARLERAIRIAP